MAKLFGFSIDDNDKLASSAVSPVPQNNEDGVDHYLTSGFFGAYVDIEGVYRTEFDMIKRYREMALHPEVDSAIEDIVNEAIVSDTNDSPIKIELSNLNASDGIKEKIREEFKHILELLDFDKKSHEIYRNWYIDGRLYYHKVIDFKKPQEGIQELRYIDAMKMRYVRKQKKKKGEPNNAQILRVTDNPMDFDFPDIEEYFLFDPKASYPVGAMGGQNLGAGGNKGAVPIARDAVTYCTSGLVDRNKGITLSYLHKAIKSLNQLRMIEDSLVIYRLSRAPERRIFYIDVGNLPKVKAEQYLRDVMMRYRNKLTYNACLAMDTQIPLLDGRTLTLEQITEEFNKGERLWTYSCDPNTGKFAPGIISWAGVTRKDEKVMRITLDNDKTITCTLDHKFPTWNKGIVEAQNLEVGDSMIPFYPREKSIRKGKNTYNQIYENESKRWEFVHRLVSEWKDTQGLLNEYNYNPARNHEDKRTVHHVDYNRYNNTPENLVRMSRDDHFDYHKQHSTYSGKIGGRVTAQRKREQGLPFFNITPEQQSELGRRNGAIAGKKCYENKTGIHGLTKEETIANSRKGNETLNRLLKTDPEFRARYCRAISIGLRNKFKKDNPDYQPPSNNINRLSRSKVQTIEYTEQIYSLVEQCAKECLSIDDTLKFINESLDFDSWKELNSNRSPRRGKGDCDPLEKFSYSNLKKICKILGFKDWRQYRGSFVYRNHKIAKIEFLDVTMDVGTLSIDNEEQYHNHHTFALESGIYTCNSTGELQTDKKFMSMLEDFWLPRREGGRGTEITTLPGGQNLGEITDIKYFQEKLYRSLNVPPTRIGGEGGFNLGRSSEILRDELKFTKFVGRLRKRFSNMFNDMLKTQLILKNIITPEDWKEMREHIQYDFLYDNHFSELKEAELMTERLNMAATAEPYIGKYYSQDYVRRKILRQTDEEIVEQDILIKKEIERGVIPDPNAQVDPNTGLPMAGQQPPQDNIQGASGDVPIDPQSADDKAVELPKDKPL